MHEQRLDDTKQQSEVLKETIAQETQQREKMEKRCKDLEKVLAKHMVLLFIRPCFKF